MPIRSFKSIDEQPFLQNALDDMLAENVRYPGELARLTPERSSSASAPRTGAKPPGA